MQSRPVIHQQRGCTVWDSQYTILSQVLINFLNTQPLSDQLAEPLGCSRRSAKRHPKSSCWVMSVEKPRCRKAKLKMLLKCLHMDTILWVISSSKIPMAHDYDYVRSISFDTETGIYLARQNHSLSSTVMRLSHCISSPMSEWSCRVYIFLYTLY